ncbi:MAG TPA: hypothetical protein PLO62_09280 [Candidatus Hydrogenedentes bacterium]|nr:hypothetical protein [Candidatus Hydrogenedentota bacterium]
MPVEQSEGDTLDSEGLAQASRSGRGQKLATASWRLAIWSCPLLWLTVPSALSLALHWMGFPPIPLPSLGLAIIALALAPVAIVTGHLAIAKNRPGRVPRRALFGTVLGYLNIVVPVALVTLAYYGKGRPSTDLVTCQNNLRNVQTALREYRDKHFGMFPDLSSQAGVLMFSPDAIRLDPHVFTCPTIRYAKKRAKKSDTSDKHVAFYSNQNYYYLGYAVFNDDDVEAFAKAYRKQSAEGGTFDKDLVVEDANGTHVLRRLSDSVFKDLPATKDRRSPPPLEGYEQVGGYQTIGVAPTDDVPILIERDLGHEQTDWGPPRPVGAHVFYAYSGIHFIERGTWPMTEKTQRILAELAGN